MSQGYRSPAKSGLTAAKEPWRRFERKVDEAGEPTPTERARRANIACRAHMGAIARKSVKARAAAKARGERALRQGVAREPTEKDLAAFQNERDETMAVQILSAAMDRSRGLADLRRRQLPVRRDCILPAPVYRRRSCRWLTRSLTALTADPARRSSAGGCTRRRDRAGPDRGASVAQVLILALQSPRSCVSGRSSLAASGCSCPPRSRHKPISRTSGQQSWSSRAHATGQRSTVKGIRCPVVRRPRL